MYKYRYLENGDPPSVMTAPVAEAGPDEDAPGYNDEDEQMLQEAGPAPASAPVPGAPPPSYLTLDALDQPTEPIVNRFDGTVIQDVPTPRTPNRGEDLPAPATPPANYTNDIAALRAAYQSGPGGPPVKTAPNWIERIGAGALGGAAGWSNAASRTRNPIDIGAATQGILYPGYQGRLAEWQSRVAPLEKAAEISGQQAAAQWKAQQIQSEQSLKAGQTDAAIAHAEYWRHRAQVESNKYKEGHDKNGNIIVIDSTTGEVKKGPPTMRELYEEALAIPGTTPAQANEYARYGGKPPANAAANRPTVLAPGAALMGPDGKPVFTNPPRPVRETDPAIAADRDARLHLAENAASDKIDEYKNSREQSLNAQRALEIRAAQSPNSGLVGDAVTKKINEINSRYVPLLQNVQNEYAASIRRRPGGTADDYDVKADNAGNVNYSMRGKPAAAVQPQQPQQPQAPRKYNAQGKAVEWNGKAWIPVP